MAVFAFLFLVMGLFFLGVLSGRYGTRHWLELVIYTPAGSQAYDGWMNGRVDGIAG